MLPDTIITSDTPSSSSQFNSSSRIICRVCQKQYSQYTCPRCNTRYCSLPCYKSHSLHCTESFMRENVEEELRQLQPDDESKQKMLHILKRFHSEEQEMDYMDEHGSDSDSESLFAEETVRKILSGSQVGLDDLSVEEQKHFLRAIASGELSKLLKPWEPWWLKRSANYTRLSQDGTQLVQPLDNTGKLASSHDNIENDQVYDIPPGPDAPLPSVRRLSATEPSPLLTVHLVDIIYSYCFTLRLYNGDWSSDSTGSVEVLLSISSVLGQGGQPETVLEALSYCSEQTCSPAYRHMGGSQFALNLMDDVTSVLYLGGAAIVCLLCDLQRLIQAAEKEFKSEKSGKSRGSKIKTKLKSAERKVYFIKCWANEQPNEAWSSLAAIVKAEKSSAMAYITRGRYSSKKEEGSKPKDKPMICEFQ
ncbi:zinc finger HIT domain-containing protein 2 isoform X1 [Coffea eugenioides]|uniref:Uncharacterized protein isoform X1 n=1 Tax=Coffea arabica TaxID=13443 RepID=A0A6P6TMK7_COFAR|nr:zinc finger HIT domain-containing protein 2-like isoform X1 [Coffea arabica]XP_027181378.1 zinc finger HIT domain-containing protein 2 isoform X1 [Coffea eugenioides]